MATKSRSGEEAERQFWEEASPREEWAYLAERLRLEIIHKLSRIREEQGASQASLARRTRTTAPMLSRFFGGSDTRSPTLETLVKVAWGLKKCLKVDFVDLHQKPLAAEGSPELLPMLRIFEHERKFIEGSGATAALKLAQCRSVSLRRFNVEAPSGVTGYKPRALSLFSERRVEHGWSGSGSARTLRIQVHFYSTASAAVKEPAVLLIAAAFDVDYLLTQEAAGPVLEKLPQKLMRHGIAQALPKYDELVSSVASNMGVSLSAATFKGAALHAA